MLLLDNGTPTLLNTADKAADTAAVQSEFGKMVQTRDSITHAIRDSVKSLREQGELKDLITGDNTIIKDGLHSLTEMTVAFIPKLIAAILVLWIGFKLTKLLKKIITKGLDRRKAEPSVKSFLVSLTEVLLKAMIIIMAMDIIGIRATSFIALLGAMGLAVGMALQGTLQNFAGGVIILLLRPFKVDDYIECDSYKGYIKEIRIFHTIMRPFNGRTIIIPNSELATKSLINYTKEPQIRLDVVASVAYGTDIRKAKEVLWDLIRTEKEVEWEPKRPNIVVSELGESSVDLTLRLWVKAENYWLLKDHISEDIYIAFNNSDIEIPFPQITVHQGKETAPIHMEPREEVQKAAPVPGEAFGSGE